MEQKMPVEGPEVKRMVNSLQVVEGKFITNVSIVGGRYARGMAHDIDRLTGARLTHVLSKGKLITFYFSKENEIPFAALNTIGASGQWVVLDKEEHELDKYRRIEFQFEDGTTIAFFDVRNFSTFRVVSFAEAKRKQTELGPDILAEPRLWAAIALPEFITRVARFAKNQTLADGLLDQRICSGCGVYVRSDAMYLARLSPHQPMAGMSDADLARIWRALHVIAVHSVLNEAPPTAIKTLPYPRCEGREFSNLVYQKTESPAGLPIEMSIDNDRRPVYWSPAEQF
jgi:formamidopyrimidine-DNA glycosylase